VLAAASTVVVAADGNPLAAEVWRTRPLVVVVPAAHDPVLIGIEAALRNETTRAGFAEREMVLYKVVAGQGSRESRPLSAGQTKSLLEALGVTASGPAVVFLVGKDGGIKVKERHSVSLGELFATIDQMPMRRRR
jgi:hypothetical protein